MVHDKFGKRPVGQGSRFGKKVRLPYERAGTMMVFKIFDRMSYGLVVGARGPMQVADRVYNPTNAFLRHSDE